MWNALVAGLSILALNAVSLEYTLAEERPFRLIVTELQAPLVPNSVMYLAGSEGFFERAGVDVELVHVQQTPSAVAALRAGEGDMANLATEAVLRLKAEQRMDLKAVMSPNKAIPYLIAAREEIASVDQLAGANFGIGRPGSLDHVLTREVLRSHGLDVSSLALVSLGQPQIRARALDSGNIDATTISIGTWLSMPSKVGLHVLIPQDRFFEAAPIIGKVNVVTDAVLEQKHDQLLAVVDALVMASRAYAQNPESWVAAMSRLRPDAKREDLEQLVKSFQASWSVNGGLSRSELERTQDFVFSDETFSGLRAPDLREWVSFAPLEAVLSRRGIVEGSDEVDLP